MGKLSDSRTGTSNMAAGQVRPSTSSDKVKAKAPEPHRIKLVDRTKPAGYEYLPDDETSTTEPEFDRIVTRIGKKRSKNSRLSKRITQGSVKEELSRRKYAKWKRPDDDLDSDTGEIGDNDKAESIARLGTDNTMSTTGTSLMARKSTRDYTVRGSNFTREDTSTSVPENTSVAVTDTSYASEEHQQQDNNVEHADQASRQQSHRPTSAIDILYENQRGYFFFGVPVFSSNSLLNFDPPAWVTSSGGPSPVDTQTAQVPDPSWEWAWQSWYVDMTPDVDEKGWQYSFAFFKGLAWHGTHPWFHSFVRRRRWIRKRIRRREMQRKRQIGRKGTSVEEHESTENRVGTYQDNADEEDLSNVEIRDIDTLLQRLRRAAVDRERIGAIKRFVRDGDDEETARLANNMPHIMSLFLFDSSRRQVVHLLKRENTRLASTSQPASDGSAMSKSPSRPKHDASKPTARAQHLQTAVAAASSYAHNLQYWSDLQTGTLGSSTEMSTSASLATSSVWARPSKKSSSASGYATAPERWLGGGNGSANGGRETGSRGVGAHGQMVRNDGFASDSRPYSPGGSDGEDGEEGDGDDNESANDHVNDPVSTHKTNGKVHGRSASEDTGRNDGSETTNNGDTSNSANSDAVGDNEANTVASASHDKGVTEPVASPAEEQQHQQSQTTATSSTGQDGEVWKDARSCPGAGHEHG